jgi:uncharacterized membrane protein HdeD (DUF308 family)
VRSRAGEDLQTSKLVWAVAFIVAGIALLLFNFDRFAAYEPLIQYIFSALLAIGGIGFFGSYMLQRSHWWRLIPGWTLLAFAGMLYLTTFETVDQRLTAALLFLGQALAFAHVYLLDREKHWWAVIPGGFMVVLGGVIALSSRTEDPEALGTALFVGMGLVFLLLYLLSGRNRPWWALIPGSVLVIFGIFVFSLERTGQNLLLRWWPLLLILLGIFLGWGAFRKGKPQKLEVNSASNLSHYSTARQRSTEPPPPAARGQLGEYHGPAPGASVEVLSDPDEE